MTTCCAIHPGSGSEMKNWPIHRFIEVARSWLAPNDKRKVVIVGGEADQAPVERLRSGLPNDRVELVQNLTLTELAGRLQRCGVFLGHDSGISHLAAAVGTPALLLFGPTDPAIWAPANPQVRVLRSSSLTMAGIGVDEVMLRADAHRHQDVEERALDLDHARAHLVDEVEEDFVFGEIAQRRHQEFRVERDRKFAALVGDRQ